MKSLLLIGVGLVLAGIACNPEKSLDDVLKDKRCRDHQCADGYECNLDDICVPRGSELSAVGGMAGSAADDPSLGGAGGVPQEVATSGDPPVGAGGAAGAESTAAGAGGVSSSEPEDPDAGCVKQLLFIDRDGDGYGSDALEDAEVRCPSAGWVDVKGDCFDAFVTADNHAELVHFGQTSFFPEGYPLPDRPGEVSFDYDCDGEEIGDPDNSRKATDCAAASTSNCGVAFGIAPGSRSGPNINSFCGSTTGQTCNLGTGNQCVAELVQGASAPFLCH